MKRNMGSIDRILRTLIALVVGVLFLTEQITGVAAIILGIFAVVFLLTSFVGVCPLYHPLKINTAKRPITE